MKSVLQIVCESFTANMAAAVSSQILNLKPFDDTGFSNWQFRVKLVLEQPNVLKVLEPDLPSDAIDNLKSLI